jgi:hypothetical protein
MQSKQATAQVEQTTTAATADKKTEELVFDMDSGEMVTREEYNRRNKERQEMEGIEEDDDEEEGNDDEEDN